MAQAKTSTRKRTKKTTNTNTSVVSPLLDPDRKYYCTCCGKSWKQQKTHFYLSRSPLYTANNGYIHICCECLNIYYDQMLAVFSGDEARAVEYICHQFDWYFSPSAFQRLKNSFPDGTNMLSTYIRKGRAYADGTYGDYYTDTIKQRNLSETSPLVDVYATPEAPTDSKVSQSARLRWGSTFDDDKILELEDHYKMLHRLNPNCSNNQEIFIKQLCQINMVMNDALRSGKFDTYTKASAEYRNTFKQAELQSGDATDASANETFGVTLATISKYTPEEYYKDKTLYKDFDGIGDYFKRFVKRPLKNLQFGTKERDKEFSVPDEGDSP